MKTNPFAAASAGIALSLALAAAAEAATIRVVALTGQEAPGTGGAVFSGFDDVVGPALNNSGETAFLGFLSGESVDGLNRVGVFTSGALVVRGSDEAPGAGGALFSNVFSSPVLNDAGNTAFVANITGEGVDDTNNFGIFASGAFVARVGSPAPGLSGAVFTGFGDPVLNNPGEVEFLAFLEGEGVTSENNVAIFSSTGPVVRKGDVAPGTGGAVFEVSEPFSGPSLNDAGERAFFGSFGDIGQIGGIGAGLFTSKLLVVQSGDTFVEADGVVIGGFGLTPSINNLGDIAFRGQFNTGGTPSDYFSGIVNAGTLVAKSGEEAPGTGGAIFQGLNGDPALNDAGDTAFLADLPKNSKGIFATSGGVLDLILREGDLLDIGGGDLRTISMLSFGQSGFNNNGDIAFFAAFTAGAGGAAGSGIFVYEAGSVSAAVPLPPALGFMLFGLAALGFAGRRRARA